MRTWMLLPLLLVGCDDFAAPPIQGEDTGPSGCAEPGWVSARSASLVMTRLQVDASTVIPGFNQSITVDGEPAACVDPDGMGGKWFFTVGGEPFGSITLIAQAEGDQDLSTDGRVVVDLFGALDAPIFRGEHVRTGAWTVTQTGSTFATNVQDMWIERDGRTARLTFSAEASR